MKKALLIVLSLAALLFTAIFFVAVSLDNINLKSELYVHTVIEKVNSYIEGSNKFPENIEQFKKEEGIKNFISYGPFENEIFVFIHDGDLKIEYYQWPVGPFKGFNFKEKEWYFTE